MTEEKAGICILYAIVIAFMLMMRFVVDRDEKRSDDLEKRIQQIEQKADKP